MPTHERRIQKSGKGKKEAAKGCQNLNSFLQSLPGDNTVFFLFLSFLIFYAVCI